MKKVALITGASRGIGKEIALRLAADGYDICLNYVGNEDEALEVKGLLEDLGSRVLPYNCDVTDFNAVAKMVETCAQELGSIDLLVNNSGITRDGLVLRMTEEDFKSVIDVNLTGTFNCIKHVSSVMFKQRSGVIVNISSVVGVAGNAGQANYSASKAGVIGLTKTCAREFAARNIRVNAVAPGFIRTAMTDKLSDKVKETVVSQIPLRTFGEPSDVANLVAFLASDNARYITGQVVHVDGGMII